MITPCYVCVKHRLENHFYSDIGHILKRCRSLKNCAPFVAHLVNYQCTSTSALSVISAEVD